MSAPSTPVHPPTHLADHFDSLETQHHAAKLGMWIFLITEILLFSGLFLAYTVYRWLHPEIFADSSDLLNIWMGTTNTVVLICSSLTMALAVRGGQLGSQRQQVTFLALTLLLACCFLVIKYFEYMAKFEHGIFPGKYYNPHGDYALIGSYPYARTFFSIYFMMTGLHGLHVLMGMAAIGWVLWRAVRNEFTKQYYTPIEVIGLYWHLVDIIWIFLFPLLYLIDRAR